MSFELYCYIACGAIISAFLFTLCAFPMLGILQQSGYSEKAFFKWYYRRKNMLSRRFSLLTLSLVLLVILFDLCFSFAGAAIANLVSALPFVGVCALFLYASRHALKVPLRRTGRSARLAVCTFLITACAVFGVCVGFACAAAAIDGGLAYLFRFAPVTLFPLLMPALCALSSVLMKAYELPRNNRYIRRAGKLLAESPCIKIGVTGSFGKTSVKTYACTILSQKYRVIATPSSYNTPMGIARTVFERGTDCDVFLAEMGARKTGDVAALCELVKPEYGVITGVCGQHLQTFGSLQAIAKEKGALAEYARHVVLGMSAAEVTQKSALREGVDFAAENVSLSADGTAFDLRLKETSVPVKTALLGRHAAEDVALAAALCSAVGMTAEEIAAGIASIQPAPHRLQKTDANGLHIFDDSYNANSEGAKNAVEVLRLSEGKKYVVTPGIVELGEMEEEENAKLGALLAGLDGVILVGETLVLAVRKGYLDAGGAEEKLKTVPTLAGAQEILAAELRAGDSVLFLNDLPDIYN